MKLKDIGELLGISKQRVHQILTGYSSPANLRWRNELHGGMTREEWDAKRVKEIAEVLKRRQYRNEHNIAKITGVGGGRDQTRELVRIRDNRTCQKCGLQWQKGMRRLDVHHLDEEREGTSFKKGASAWDRKNTHRMITLCHKCHFSLDSVKKKISTKGGKYNVKRTDETKEFHDWLDKKDKNTLSTV